MNTKGSGIRTILSELRVAKANRKKEIIKVSMTDTLKEVFRAALSPLHTYQVSKAPADILKNRPRRDLLSVLGDLELVRTRGITGNACKEYIQELHDSLEDDDRFVFRCVIEKDLKCGVQAITVNSALGYNLIPIFPSSLCTAYSAEAVKKFTYPCIAQEKLDGARVCFFKEGDSILAYSRNGREFSGLSTLLLEIKKLNVDHCVLDGELTVYDGDTVASRKIGNGILNKSIKGTITEHEASHIVVTLFDIVPTTEWHKKKSMRSYIRRWTTLACAVRELSSIRVKLPVTEFVHSGLAANAFYQAQLSLGKEGAVLKTSEGIWEPKRLKSMLKMKVQNDVDLEIVAVVVGEGKHIGALGAFTCKTCDDTLLVSVGSGFSDAQRVDWFTNDLVGTIVTVRANDYITRSGSDTHSLYLPTFVKMRYDKNIADSLQKVKQGFDQIYGRVS